MHIHNFMANGYAIIEILKILHFQSSDGLTGTNCPQFLSKASVSVSV